MSSSRPKRLSSIKALEDIQDMSSSSNSKNKTPTSKKKETKSPATNNFVFISDDEASSSSSEEEEEEEATKKKPARKSNAKQQPRNSTKKLHTEPNSLFALLQRAKQNCGDLAMKWLSQCTSEDDTEHEQAISDLCTLLLQSSGGTPASPQTRFKKTVTATMDLTASQAVSFSTTCLIVGGSKNAEHKRFHANFAQFFHELGKQVRQSGNREAIFLATEACVAASQSPVRAQLRVAGTLAAMRIGSGLLTRARELQQELKKSLQLFSTEQQACEARIPASQEQKQTKLKSTGAALVTSLQALLAFSSSKDSAKPPKESLLDPAIDPCQEALERWRDAGRGATLTDKIRQIASELLKTARDLRLCERTSLELQDSVFVTVAQARFRDVDHLVRVEVARELKEWSRVYDVAMTASHRSKYLGWMLSDKHSAVRLEALQGLQVLGSQTQSPEVLAAFVSRFANRVMEMLNDVDESVICGAVDLVAAWTQRKLVTREEHDELLFDCEELLFAEETPVAAAAARFAIQLEPKLLHEEMEVRTRTLCELVLKHLIVEGDEEEEGEPLEGQAHREAVKALEAFDDELCTVDSICALLTRNDTFCDKSVHVPQMLCAMLVSVLQQDKKNQATAELALGRSLADLLIKFRTDETCLESLMKCLPLCRFPTPALQEKAMRELVVCITERNAYALLIASAQALSILLDQRKDDDTLQPLVQDAFNKICTTCRSLVDDENSGAMSRCATLTICVPSAGRKIILDEHDLCDRITRHMEMDEWLCSAVQTLVFLDQVEPKLVNKCFTHVLGLAPAQDKPGLICRLLGLFFDARTLFWPGELGMGWLVSEELIAKADELFMGMISHNEALAMPQHDSEEMICNQVLLPHSRVAMFASAFQDSKTPAYILRFASFDHMQEFKRIAMRLNGELRKQDPIRWLMSHLETICLDVNYAEALVRMLGPPSQKASVQLSKAVSIMVCQAIRVAVEKQDDSILLAVAPYLAFCKDDKQHQHMVDLWEKEAMPVIEQRMQQHEEEERFGEAFADRLYGRTKPKKRTAAAAGDELSSPTKQQRRLSSSARKKRNEEEDEEVTPKPRKRKSLNLPSSHAAVAKPLEFKKSKTEEDLERSVFEEEEEEQIVAEAVEETPLDDDEEDEDEVIGFRPKTTW